MCLLAGLDQVSRLFQWCARVRSAGGVRNCSVCYGVEIEWTKYTDNHPLSPSQADLCTVGWAEKDSLAADWTEIKEKNVPNHRAESYTPPVNVRLKC
jgi:hypothetical protein